jgi:3-oxoadipate enol-lactonase
VAEKVSSYEILDGNSLSQGTRLRVNGAELFVSTQGPSGAPWVVLLNSLAADTRMWAPQAAALCARYRVMRLDWRGHGRSRDEPAPYSLDMLATDVVDAMAALGVNRPHVAGTSLGGMVGMLMAIQQRTPLASLTVISALSRIEPSMGQWWADMARRVRREGVEKAAAEGTISRWFTPAYLRANPAVVHDTRLMIAGTSVEAYAGCIAAFDKLDLQEDLSFIDVPTLFVVGEQDPASTPEIMRRMHRRVPGSRLQVIGDAAHMPGIERPAELSRALLDFFASVEPAEATP